MRGLAKAGGVEATRSARHRSCVRSAFFASPSTRLALGVLCVLVLVVAFASVIARYDPNEIVLSDRLMGPSWAHWLGTDRFGRDIWARLLFGGQKTLVAALEATGVAIVLGVPLGLIAGHAKGIVDAIVNPIADTLLALPALILALAIIGIAGPGLGNAMLAIGIVLAPRFYRVARTAARSIHEETYIEAARSIGGSQKWILWRHVLPNASGPLLVMISFAIGLATVAEAGLSFLGLGVQDPASSWGSMVRDAFSVIRQSSWSIYPPAVAISLTILLFSVIGDALRDAFGQTETHL